MKEERLQDATSEKHVIQVTKRSCRGLDELSSNGIEAGRPKRRLFQHDGSSNLLNADMELALERTQQRLAGRKIPNQVTNNKNQPKQNQSTILLPQVLSRRCGL